jgi:cobalt-zinc-cadmium efflux system protein
MFTHSFAIFIGLIAIYFARNPPCHHRTFGMYRAEVLAAFINGLFLMVIVGTIIYDAIIRILNPQEIEVFFMFIIAVIGLVVNLLSIFILRGSHRDDINVRSVFYHMIADAASSIGIVTISIIITFTNWTILDPIVSFGISIIILFWALGILKESTRILLEMAPKGLNIDDISDVLKKQFSAIKNLSNTHIWTITPNMLFFTTQIEIENSEYSTEFSEELTAKIGDFLTSKYNILESTIQITHGIADVCED